MADLENIIRFAVQYRATDLHFSRNQAPRVRIDERLTKAVGLDVLDFDDMMSQLLFKLDDVQRAKVEEAYKKSEDVDFSFTIPDLTRVRANLYTSASGNTIALRLIPLKRLSCEEIGLPSQVIDITNLSSGLFIVTGPNGSGKTSTLAALIDQMNNCRDIHILTLEDPIEYLFESRKALVTQREIGTHSPSFAKALRSSVRENPDVIVLGEMRDLESARAAIELAETGHLVFATMHTRTSISTVDRLVSLFPSAEQQIVSNMLSEILRGVLSQVLLARKGGGLIAGFELLLSTPAVKNLIRESKLTQIESVIQTSSNLGMIKLEDYMIKLIENGMIEPSEAISKAVDRGVFIEKIRRNPRIAHLV